MNDEHGKDCESINLEHTEVVQFEEDGDAIQMEINDGGAAAKEFASDIDTDEENSVSQNETFDNSEDSESDQETAENSDPDPEFISELGEIVEDSGSEAEPEPVKKVKKSTNPKHKRKRESVEDRLDNLSNTLIAMKELLTQKGLVGETTATAPSSQSGKNETVVSTSDTTIYNNALDKITDQTALIAVDPEISFKVTEKDEQGDVEVPPMQDDNKGDSYSSDNRVDTSDEMINMDIDLSTKFIADCEAEARRSRKRSFEQNEDWVEDNPRCEADEVI